MRVGLLSLVCSLQYTVYMKDDITPKDPNKEINKLDRELYDPQKDHGQRDRRKIHGREIELEHDFDDDYDELINTQSKYKLPTSLFKKIFFAVLVFFVATIAVAGISLYEGKTSVSEDLIALEILGQPFVDGGEELELQVRIQNFNEQALESTDIVVSYPKDSSVDAERVFLRRSLRDIEPKQRITEEFDIILFGQEGDVRDIQAIFEYRIEGSSSIFKTEANHDVTIRSTPTQVAIDAPDTIVRNQEVTFKVDISSNSNKQINNTVLKIDYPRGFEFLRSSVSPDFNNDTWYFSTIADHTEEIEITGRLAALEGQGQSFNLEFGRQNQFNKNQIETVFNAITHTIEVQKSFIETTLTVNGNSEQESTIRGGSDVQVDLKYKNTLTEALENAIITVHLAGDLYDREKVRANNGFYNSSQNVIVYDQTTSERLQLLQPGEEGSFSISLASLDLVSSAGVLSNPTIELLVDVEGTEINGNNRNALSVASHTISANSDISVSPKTLHYEGPFNNSGAMPPRVNTPTQYTLVFQVSNSSNTVNDAELTTFLPPYVEWLNNVAPSVERNTISYDTVTRKVTWNLDTLRSGLGVGTSQPRQVSVQVEVIPSATHIGSKVDLTRDIMLSGTDEFTGTNLSFKKAPLTSLLENTDAVGYNGKVVN